MASVQPIVQALLVADKVYTDQSGKKIICGVFHRLKVIRKEQFQKEIERREGKIPIVPGGYAAGSPFAYACLTGVHGEQPIVLRYVDLELGSALFQFDLKIRSDDPLASLEIVLALPTLPTNKTGLFGLEMLWKEISIGMFRITVEEVSAEA
jgi:hypothetical protein